MNSISQIFVGVDVAKDFLDVHFYPIKKAFRISNNLEGIKQLKSKLSMYNVGQIACEATGGYEQLLVKELKKIDYCVWVIEPKRIKAFIISEGIKVKTDQIDAKMIALFSSQKKPKYEKIFVSGKHEELKALTKCREDLIDMMLKENNRFKSPNLIYCQDIKSKIISFLKDQIKDIDAKIIELIKVDKELQAKANIILSIPGVGPITTSALISQMPELGIVNNKQAAAIVGVAPIIRQSGNSRGIASIQGGRHSLRTVLYMATLVAIRYNSKIKIFYEHLLSLGKKPKVAIVASMRKLIVILNVMIKKGETWQIS